MKMYQYRLIELALNNNHSLTTNNRSVIHKICFNIFLTFFTLHYIYVNSKVPLFLRNIKTS